MKVINGKNMINNLVGLSFEDIKDAAKKIHGVIDNTPTNHAITLSKITGAEVYIKPVSYTHLTLPTNREV